MKTQISRDSHQKEKRYSGVYQQQGRMLTDADWNELVEILKERLNEALKDVVGNGTPRVGALSITKSETEPPKIMIRKGDLYVDGIRAELLGEGDIPFEEQPDFPISTDYLPGNKAYYMYADVWERTVTSLEDPEPEEEGSEQYFPITGQRDPGLHGADTCTRKQTLLQVKWCPADETLGKGLGFPGGRFVPPSAGATPPGIKTGLTRGGIKLPGGGIQLPGEITGPKGEKPTNSEEDFDPEKEIDIPKIGNAPLTLKLRTDVASGDPCDPCAKVIQEGLGRIGNYLFRVEVHDVEGPAEDPTKIVLKWSSENGAEQYRARDEDKMPPGFVHGGGKYVYEFYNTTSEKHLGVHLAGEFEPARGVLSKKYEIPPEIPHGGDVEFVRRWDGSCKLEKTEEGWSLVEGGTDKGVPLEKKAEPTSTAHGAVTLDSHFQVYLERLILELELEEKIFVAGDYWLAPVREEVQKPGSVVLDHADPNGILHHYLCLAHVSEAGDLTLCNDCFSPRRYKFPPLTDINAGDVGYKPTCKKEEGELYYELDENTVQEALDRLCKIAAEHIGYKADCEKGWLKDFSGTVKGALEKICGIEAKDIAFSNPCVNDIGLFKDEEIKNVADALELICKLRAEYIPFKSDCTTGIFQGFTSTIKEALEKICTIEAADIKYNLDEKCGLFENKKVKTVKDALIALCNRPSGRGCRVTICSKGEGDYPSIDEALVSLMDLKQGLSDICICLLPGDHGTPSPQVLEELNSYNAEILKGTGKGLDVSIIGCGSGSRVNLRDYPVYFIKLNSLVLKDFRFEGSVNYEAPLFIEGCADVNLSSLNHVGLAVDQPLVKIGGAQRIQLIGNKFEALLSENLENPVSIFEFDKGYSDLFSLSSRNEFLKQVPAVAQEMSNLFSKDKGKAAEVQNSLASRTSPLIEQQKISSGEQLSYERFMNILASEAGEQKVEPAVYASALVQIYDKAREAALGCALALMDSSAQTIIKNNNFQGAISLYGEPPSGTIIDYLAQNIELASECFYKLETAYNLSTSTVDFHFCNNEVTRFILGSDYANKLHEILTNNYQGSSVPLPALFQTGFFTDNTIKRSGNYLYFGHLDLTSCSLETADVSDMDFALVLGSSSIYMGNKGKEGNSTLYNRTTACRESANLNLIIQDCNGGTYAAPPQVPIFLGEMEGITGEYEVAWQPGSPAQPILYRSSGVITRSGETKTAGESKSKGKTRPTPIPVPLTKTKPIGKPKSTGKTKSIKKPKAPGKTKLKKKP